MSKADQGRPNVAPKLSNGADAPIAKQDRDKSDSGTSDHGIMRDAQGQEQPADKARAQHVSRNDGGDDPPGYPQQ